jgi:O-antigen/teichoic acid export membrane protein
MIPITTAKLDPKDFGLFAILYSFGAVVTSFSMLGSGYLWAAYFPRLQEVEKPPFVTTLLTSGLAVCLFWTMIFWLLWPLHEHFQLGLESKDKFLYALILLGAVAGYPWVHAIDYLTLDMRASGYAAIMIFAVIFSALATVFCLYYLKLHILSLFIGQLTNSIILGAGSICVLHKYLKPTLSGKWVKTLFSKGVPTVPGNIFESGAFAMERNVISAQLSLSALGLYTHSQSYRNLGSVGIKALARTIWPVSLDEARIKSPHFPQTRAAWEPLFFILTIGGLLSGAIGKEAISILTHGKFTEAAAYVTAWFVFIAVQNAGKEQVAVLYAAGQSVFITYLTVICQIIFIGLLFVLIPAFGVWGAIIAAICQQFLYRVFVQFRAGRIQNVPFNDKIVVISSIFIAIALAVQIIYWNEILLRILILSLVLIFYIHFFLDVVKQLMSLASRKMVGFFRLIRASQQ